MRTFIGTAFKSEVEIPDSHSELHGGRRLMLATAQCRLDARQRPIAFDGKFIALVYNKKMIRAIELRHFNYFIAVAEEAHFGRAALRLFISQPSLSFAIQQLEDRLGAKLIDRSNRRDVQITNAGETLLAYAREVLASAETAVSATQAAARQDSNQLRVGYCDGESLARHPGLLGAATKTMDVTLTFQRLIWGTEGDAVRSGKVDVLLAKLPIDVRGLRVEVLACEPRLACLRADHRLANRKQIKLAALRGEPTVCPIGGTSQWVDFWRALPRPDGHTPPDGPQTFGPEETLDAVASGAAICFVPASMIPTVTGDNFRFVPVTDLAPVETAVLWSSHRARPAALDCFIGAVRQLLTQHAQ
jgi:DNA-binding transcriptional LysR family regulator